MESLKDIFTKENANWLAPLITIAATLGLVTLFKGGVSTLTMLGTLAAGGMAFLVSAAATESSIFHPSTVPGNILENTKDKIKRALEDEKANDGPRFDHLMYQLIEKNEGIFLGENHYKPMVVETISKLLPAFKARGVGTIGIERTPEQMMYYETVADKLEGKKLTEAQKELLALLPPEEMLSLDIAAVNLVRDTRKMGLKLIGYEMPNEDLSPRVRQAYDRIRSDGYVSLREEYDYTNIILEEATSLDGMKKRDAWSAEYIKQQKEGKIILIGGAQHSANHTKIDSIFNISDGYGVIWNYKGINTRLNYPSVDFVEASPEHPIGTTEKENGKFHDYKAYLNDEMSDLNTTSWPLPPGTTPYVPESHLPKTNIQRPTQGF